MSTSTRTAEKRKLTPRKLLDRAFIDAMRETLDLEPLYAPHVDRSDVERFYVQPWGTGGYQDGNRRILPSLHACGRR